MKTFPISAPNSEITPFYKHISDILESNLNNYEKNHTHNTLVLLKTLSADMPEFLDRYLPLLLKVIQVGFSLAFAKLIETCS